MGKNPSTEHVNKSMNSFVASQKALATEKEIRSEFMATDTLMYFKNDTYIAKPQNLLGKVFYKREGKAKTESFLVAIDAKVDEESLLESPVTRSEILLDKKASASVGFLKFLSASASAEDVYELRVIDNAAARVIDRGVEWTNALMKWMALPLSETIIKDPKVAEIMVVTGVVQKYITKKVYRKFDAKVKGGAFGINIGGSLYTSSSEFTLDIVYGLDFAYLPRVTSTMEFIENAESNALIEDRVEIERLTHSFAEMAYEIKDLNRLI